MFLILLWMLLFSLLHSVMADKRIKLCFRQLLGERAYEAFYRLFYNSVAVLSLIPLFFVMELGQTLFTLPTWLSLIFVFVQIIGLLGLALSLLQIDWLRFAGLRQVLAYWRGETLPLANEALVTTGVYALVRHPLYFFSLLFLWFAPIMTTSTLVFNLAATAYFLIGSIVEERRMVEIYGAVYQDYQKSVPWMLPFLRWRFL